MAGRLFTSESVTEGHPDKIADQISDSVLDAMLEQDPHSRVAVETLLTTGLVVVAGEVHHRPATSTIKQSRPRPDPRDRLRLLAQGLRRRRPAACMVAIGGQSGDIAAGRRHRPREPHRLRGRDGQAGRRRPGPDVRLRLRRHRRADAAADRDRPAPRRAAHRGPQGRHARPTCAPTARPRSPSSTTPTTARCASTPSCSPPSTPRTIELDTLEADIKKHVIDPVLDELRRSPPRATGCWSTRPAASWSAARWATPA